jgi:carboxyl-terminal processing protease
VVDLRNNGGGSLGEANQLVGLFIETGATVQIRYSGIRNGFTRPFGDNDPEVSYDGPLAVLVNRTSASASEIFAGAIQDYQRGIVLGGQTFGKGTVQEIIPMDYGQVKLTRSKFYRISGASTQHRGVIPDIEFPDFYDAYEDIGESSLDGALPWDTVRPVEYRAYHPIQASVPQLKSMHEERAKTSPDFIYLLGQIERTRELRDREEISLNESVVKQEREDTRRQEFEAENMRRVLKGLPLEEWEDEIADEDSSDSLASSDTDVIEPEENEEDTELEEDDPLILESGRILADYISLNGRRVSSINN